MWLPERVGGVNEVAVGVVGVLRASARRDR